MISSLLPDALYSELKLPPFFPPPKKDSEVIEEKLMRLLPPLSLLKLIRLILRQTSLVGCLLVFVFCSDCRPPACLPACLREHERSDAEDPCAENSLKR